MCSIPLSPQSCSPCSAVGQPWGTQRLCRCKTLVPSSERQLLRHVRLVRRPLLPSHTGAVPGPPVLAVISTLPFRGCPLPPSQDRAVSGAVASICPRQSQVLLVPPQPCSLPSCGINCLKHFLDSRGAFCSLSLLFSMAAPCPHPCLHSPAPVLELPAPVHPFLSLRALAATFQG